MELTWQFKLPGAVAAATGGWVFCATATDAVAEQPFAVFVAVTVYVPGIPVDGFCWLDVNPPGPDQAKVAGVALEFPLSTTDRVVHVSSPVAVAVALGGVMF